MTPSQLTRRDALVGTIAAPFLAGRAAGAAEPAGVEALRGEATAQATSGVRPLAQDASVLVGDLVATEHSRRSRCAWALPHRCALGPRRGCGSTGS